MKKTRLIILTLSLLVASLFVFSQTLEDVVNTYNAGVELANTDTKAAIGKFFEAHELALKVGDEANEVKGLVESQLPTLQYKYATELYKADNMEEAIANYEKAGALAVSYGDEKTKGKCDDIIPKLYFSLGNSYYKADDYENALINFDKSLELNPQYAKVYLSKGILYKKTGDSDNMVAAMDKAIETGIATGDDNTVATASKVVRDHFLVLGNQAVQLESYDEAISYLNKATGYGDPVAEIYYLLAVANNKLSQWDAAIEAANKGIQLEDDGDDAKAKFYFELGNAQMGKGDNEAACSAFKNATYGNYTESANYQINTVLKCN